MEVLFVMLILGGAAWGFVACLEADTWAHPILVLFFTAVLAGGLYLYLQLPLNETSRRTIITDRLGVGQHGDNEQSKMTVVFAKPTTIVIITTKRWGSVENNVSFEVKAE
jgi:hypothetical protein